MTVLRWNHRHGGNDSKSSTFSCGIWVKQNEPEINGAKGGFSQANPPSRWRSNSPLHPPFRRLQFLLSQQRQNWKSTSFTSWNYSLLPPAPPHPDHAPLEGRDSLIPLQNPRISRVRPLKCPINIWWMSEKISKWLWIPFSLLFLMFQWPWLPSILNPSIHHLVPISCLNPSTPFSTLNL